MTPRMLAGALTLAALANGAGSHAASPRVGRLVQGQSEAWYLYGMLRSNSGRAFAFSIAFRRIVIARTRDLLRGDSHWRAREVIAAGITLADISKRNVLHAERIDRAALGFVGAARGALGVHVGNWSLQQTRHSFGTNAQIRIRAAARDFALQLDNRETIRVDGGAFTGLRSRGTVVLDGTIYRVTGTAGFEHRLVSAEREGLRAETFAMQLTDGREVLLRVVANEGGQTVDASGTLVERGGAVVRLAREDVGVGEWAGTHWRSPHTGISYPSLWIVGIPRANLSVTVSPVLGDQEIVPLADGRPYWAGAVDITDNSRRTGRTNIGTGWVTLDGFGAAG